MSDDTAETGFEISSKDFFTAGTFATLAGATAAVVILMNTIGSIIERYPAWLPLALAGACSLGAYVHAVSTKSKQLLRTPRALRYALVVLNACLIYTSAFGTQVVLASETIEEPTTAPGEGSETTQITATSWESIVPSAASHEFELRRIRRPVR
jgi:hypothetical protein